MGMRGRHLFVSPEDTAARPGRASIQPTGNHWLVLQTGHKIPWFPFRPVTLANSTFIINKSFAVYALCCLRLSRVDPDELGALRVAGRL